MKWLLPFLLIIQPGTAFACDIDGDGTDDPVTYEIDGATMITWRWVGSADTMTHSLSTTASASSFPAPGYYLGSGDPAYLGHIEADNVLWKAYGPTLPVNLIGFALPNVSYYPSLDVNGDGVSDLIKIFKRCNRLTRNCNRKRVEGFFVFNSFEDDSTFQNLTTATRFFGGGLSPLVALDVNGDGAKEICYAQPGRRRRKVFKLRCIDIVSDQIIERFSVGRISTAPLALARLAAQADYLLLSKQRGRRNITKITLIDPQTGIRTKLTIATTGKILTGDWLGNGYQQIGSAENGQLTILDPETQATTTRTLPTGTPVDCTNNLAGKNERRILTSRNVCRVLNCS